MKLHTAAQAIIETEDLEREVRNLLRSKGWRYIYDDIVNKWLYKKQLPDGRIILIGEERLALSFEQAIST